MRLMVLLPEFASRTSLGASCAARFAFSLILGHSWTFLGNVLGFTLFWRNRQRDFGARKPSRFSVGFREMCEDESLMKKPLTSTN
jgi:hypothetical protein